MSLPTSSPDGRISDLVALITNAANIIESHYSQSSQPYVPSLDDLAPHPLDSGILPQELINAIQILEGACAQLSATVARPGHTLLNRALQTYEADCLNVVLTFKIPDILQENQSGMHILEIGRKAGVDHGKLGRIMRLLASKHIFREVTLDCFANNRLSLQFLSENSLTSMVAHLTDDYTKKAHAVLASYLADPEWGNSQAPERSPWNKSSGRDEPLFQYWTTTPEGAKLAARFGFGMKGWNEATQAEAVLNSFPWERFPPGTTVCDVGGSVGNIAMQLIGAYPNLQLKLQDLPDCIHEAKTHVWPEHHPTAIAEKRIEFKAIDFLVDSPIEGCDVYYLKNVIHDWPDKECVQILRNIRAVLKPSSRVLLHDYVLLHANRATKSAFAEAPEPLLPNYGLGRIRPYTLDVALMALLNGKERTLEELIDLAKQADLEFVKLWDAGELGIVEFKSS